jgi:quinol monooxygenase YgiN
LAIRYKHLSGRNTTPEWATLADLQAHAASAHMQAYGAQTRDWLVSRVIHVLEPV